MRYYELTIICKETPKLSIQPVKERRGPNFVTLDFYAEPKKIAELEKELKDSSLRYMLLSKSPPKQTQSERKIPKKQIRPSPAKTFSEGKKKKVDLKEVDKKIEEILKE